MEEKFHNLQILENEKKEIRHVLACNDITYNYCLSLKEDEVKELILSKRAAFKDLEILEFNEGILPRLIEVFADSPYLLQDSYAQTLDSLQYLFYRFKSGTDEDMLELMKNTYDNVCQGSMTLFIQFFEKKEQDDRKRGKKTRDMLEPDIEYIDYTDGLYTFEEMLPILMKVSKMYVEDTSLSYNEARKLMTGVSYSIRAGIIAEKNTTSITVAGSKPDPLIMYQQGKKILQDRERKLREETKRVFAIFCDYECKFVYKTVFEELQHNISKIDVLRSPHELYIEPGYPIIGDLENVTGVDKLLVYVNSLIIEWRFLSFFSVNVVQELLERVTTNYRESFYENVCDVVLSEAIGCLIAEREVEQLQLDEDDIDTIRLYFAGDDKETILKALEKLSAILIKDADERKYFAPALRNLAVRIENASDNASLGNVFFV